MATQLLAKYKSKINWINLDEWTYDSSTFRFDVAIDDSLMLNKSSNSTNRICSNQTIIEKNKIYTIRFKLTPTVDNVFSGSVRFEVGGYVTSYYTAVGEYFFTTTNTTNTLFQITANAASNQFGIKDLIIEEVFYQELDLGEAQIELNFSVADVKDYASRSGVYSKQFVIPGTPTNNNFFKYIYETNSITSFNPNVKLDAAIMNDSYVWLYGYIKFEETLLEDNQINYKITFYGENLNLFADINEDLIENLYCPQLNHTATAGIVRNCWDFPYAPAYSAVTYPYINYGQDSTGSEKMRGIVGSAYDLTPSVGLTVSDHYPAVSVKYLVDKIFEKYGYTYTSTFLNSDYFLKQIIPFCNKEEDLYGWHLATRGEYYGATGQYNGVTFTRLQNADALPLSNYVTGKFPQLTEMRYQHCGIPTVYNPEPAYQCRYIKDVTEIYRSFNYGLNSKSYSTQSIYKHPIIISAGSNSKVNFVNPNNYQVNIQHLPGSFLCRTDGKYKFKISFSTNVVTIPANDDWKIYVHLCKINKNSVEYNDSNLKFKILDDSETVSSLGYHRRISGGGGYYFRDYLGNNLGTGQSTITLEYELDCLEGDLVYFKFLHGSTGSGYPTNWKINFKFIEVYKYGWGEGVNLKYNQILPKNIKIKDFLKDLMFMFNLYIDIDKTTPKNLIIEPRDVYYTGGTVHQWTHKLDIEQQVVYTHPQEYQNYINIMSYKDDENYHNKLYSSTRDVQKTGYGSKRFLYESDWAVGESKKSLSVFSSAPISNVYANLGDTGATSTVVTCLWDAVYPSSPLSISKKTDWSPRILFFNNMNFNNNTTNTIKYNFAGIRQTTYPFAGHINNPFNITSSSTYDLNFDTKLRTGNVYQGMFSSNPDGKMTKNNLFNMYYLKEYKQVTDKNAKILNAEFKLTDEDIINLKMNDIIEVGNTYFIINEIKNYVVGGESTTSVELLKIDTNVTGDYDIYEEINDDIVIIKPPIDLRPDVVIGINNLSRDKKNVIILGDNNSVGNNTFNLGNENYLADDSSILRGDNNVVSNKSTVINSDNVNIFGTGNTIISTSNKSVTENDVTYIQGAKISRGHYINENMVIDGGVIEIDGVFNPYKNYDGYIINDCGENGTDIFDRNSFIIVDGGRLE